jgi:uncharacterized protein (TIGR02611 family)
MLIAEGPRRSAEPETNMLDGLRQEWKKIKEGKPGNRFRDRYCEAHREGRSGARKPLLMAAGVALLIVGIVLLPAPGPGMLVIAVGGVLVAEESYAAASILDWVDLRLCRLAIGAKKIWDGASLVARTAVVVTAVALGAALAWGAYRICFGA